MQVWEIVSDIDLANELSGYFSPFGSKSKLECQLIYRRAGYKNATEIFGEAFGEIPPYEDSVYVDCWKSEPANFKMGRYFFIDEVLCTGSTELAAIRTWFQHKPDSDLKVRVIDE